MEPVVSESRDAGTCWNDRHGDTADCVRLVFVEPDRLAEYSAPQVRIEAIAPGADVRGVIAQRRPDALLIAAAIFSAADRRLPFEVTANRVQSSPRADGQACGTSQCAIKRVLDAVRAPDRQLPLIITVPAEMPGGELVLDAIQAGATDVVSDLAPAEHLREKILLATERRRLQRRPTIRVVEPVSLGSVPAAREQAIVGRCDAMLSVLCRVARFAADPVPVLFHGEPGTGKSLLALTLHRRMSDDGEQPVMLDCGQFVPNLLDRLLFDDTEGTVQLRPELGGRSLILENVDQTCTQVQRRLLAVIRHEQASPKLTVPLQAQDRPLRLVMTCSTVVDPAHCTEQAAPSGERVAGLIDELRFELAGYSIELPPLRERGSDVLKLIDHFIRELTGTAPVDETGGEHRITDEARCILQHYRWPGNVTQLRSIVAAELRLGDGAIVLSERLLRLSGRVGYPQTSPLSQRLPTATASPTLTTTPREVVTPTEPRQTVAEPNSPQLWGLAVERFIASNGASDESASLYTETIQEVEAGLITAVLEKTQGNLAQSARLLGITRVSLRRKIHALGLRIPGRPEIQ